MFWIEKITTGCVILPQIWKKIFLFSFKKNKEITISADTEAKRSAKNILIDNKNGKKKINIINNLSKLFILCKN